MEYVRVVRHGQKSSRVLLPSGNTCLVANTVLTTWTCVGTQRSENRVPVLVAQKFGCEFEFFLPSARYSECRNKLRRLLGTKFQLGSHFGTSYAKWQWTTDGSIRAPAGHTGVELKSPILSFTDECGLELRRVLAVLNECGGKVNTSTGTHVHFSFGSQPIGQFLQQKLYSTYGKWEQSFFDRIVSPSRQGNVNNYCKSCEGNAASNRYRKLNVCSVATHGTVEIRHHQGTLSANKIMSWIQVCKKWFEVVTRPNTSTPTQWDRAVEMLGLSPQLRNWVQSRYEDFN